MTDHSSDHEHHQDPIHVDWRENGVKVIPGHSVDPNTAQTPGMNRATAINRARAGAEKIWAGTVTIHANAKTGAHHHGDLESIIYVVKGKARMRWAKPSNIPPRPGQGTSFSFHLMCRTRKSMPAETKHWNASWFAPARSLSWSIWI